MKAYRVFMLALMTLAACQANRWVNLDGGIADEAGLRQARQDCGVDAKLAALEQVRGDGNEALRKASSNAARMMLRDDIQLTEKAVYAEIDACMRDEGFKRD